MVAESHGLCRLQMGETGHRRVRMRFREPDQGPLQRHELFVEAVDRIAHPEPQVGRDLIVAAACGVEAARGIADQLAQP